MRKPIQIQVVYVPENADFSSGIIQTVLCDDGTIWYKDGRSSNWKMVHPIPQPAEVNHD